MKDGGPAFPRPGIEGMCSAQDGMSLRDWFAGQSLTGLAASDPDTFNHVVDAASSYAKTAYVLADAMLAEREKPK